MGSSVTLAITESEVNVLAQRFFEAAGISLPLMTDKPLIVRGLIAVLAELDIEVRPEVAPGAGCSCYWAAHVNPHCPVHS